VVEEVGKDVARVKKGDRVLVPFSQGDGSREWCRSGHHNICDTPLVPGFAYWGGMGRYVAVPFADANLVPLPESAPFVDAASMGCRYMTSFHGVVDQAQVRAGEWVAVHGCGGIGLSAVQIATALGANAIAIDISDEKLAFAKLGGDGDRSKRA
jgi:D-arabinose 1-dehydrogenase-like Zn-dependent alcohol dehydrogenase